MTDTTKPTLAAVLVTALAAAPACKFPPPPDIDDSDAGACPFGTIGDRCADLAPSNGLAQYLDQARSGPDVELELVDINTDAVTVNGHPPSFAAIVAGSPPNEILVLIVGSLDVTDVSAHGRRALAIVSDRDVLVRGAVALGPYPGALSTHDAGAAGVRLGTDPECTASHGGFDGNGYGGSGGGGHGTAGGEGGTGATAMGGAGGAVVGNDRLEPLRGGCPGANKTIAPPDSINAPQGGAGGGAIQISTRASIIFGPRASITASGTAGYAADNPTFACPYPAGGPDGCDAGSGGGAGGGILLEASQILMDDSATIAANGGGGSCGWRGSGANGTASAAPAAGADCSQQTGVGSGGSGGAGSIAPIRGGNGSQSGGGGGGAAGRIRINLPAGVTLAPTSSVSPPPSLGEPATR